MDIKLIINDKERVINSFCGQYGYESIITVEGKRVENPISKENFMQKKICDFVLQTVTAFEINKVLDNSRKEAMLKIKQEVSIL